MRAAAVLLPVALLTAAPTGPVVQVFAHDEMGLPVAGLTASDFQVLLDGHEVPFETVGPEPLNLAVLLDMSGSVMKTMWASTVKREIPKLLVERLTAADRVTLVTFGHTVRVEPPFPADSARLTAAFKRAQDDWDARIGGSRIWDALNEAVNALDHAAGHRAVLLVTDGRASGNVMSMQGAGTRALAKNISVHSLAVRAHSFDIRQTDTIAARVSPGHGLRWLADVTGARVYPIPVPSEVELKTAVATFFGDIRSVYRLRIMTTPAQAARTLEVRSTRAGVTVIAPRGVI